MKKLLVASCVLLFTFAVSADDTTKAEATKGLFKVMNMQKTYEKSLSTMIEIQLESNPQLQPLRETFTSFMNKYLSWGVIENDMIKIYSDAFSLEELKELTAFMSTNVGKKWAEQGPELMRKGAELGQSIVKKHLPELQKMVMDELEKKSSEEESEEEPAKPTKK